MATEIGEREMGSQLADEKLFVGKECDRDEDECGCGIRYYDRDFPERCKPGGLEYFQSMADLAIDFYNKQNSSKYHVVELIKFDEVTTMDVYLYLCFTGKLDDSDAVLFQASMVDGVEEGFTITNVDIVDKCTF